MSKNKSKYRVVIWYWRLYFLGLFIFILLITCLANGWIFDMPDIKAFEHPTTQVTSQVFGNDGTPIGKYYYNDRITLNYNELNNNILGALISTEDKRYYLHNGIDFESLIRAVLFLGKKGGASTLTQQTAKNLFTENWNTRNKFLRVFQKLKELIISIKLERYFTKQEILTIYLNSVVFSENVFGLKNAAVTFFQKEPRQLNINEAALLIGMINAPSLYNPRKNTKLSLERRNLVINRMADQNFITKSQATILKKEPIKLYFKKLDENNGLAPYFRMVLGEELKKWCKEHKKQNGESYDIYKDGLKIYTTIDPLYQEIAEEAVHKHLKVLQSYFNNDKNIKNGLIWKSKSKDYIQILIKQSNRWQNLKNAGLNEAACMKVFNTPSLMNVFSWNHSGNVDTFMSPLDSIKYYKSILQSSFLVTDPQTGEVKAWVGGIDFKTFKFDHVNVNTKRQVGSTMKPLLYSFAIEKAGFSPNTLVEDVQQEFDGYNKVPATSRSCSGETMTMAKALAESKNCASAFILKNVDPEANHSVIKFIDYLRNCGISSELDPYPSLALGAEEVSMIEMLQAFSMFPGNGYNTKPFYISRIEDKNGNILASYSPQRKKVITENTAYSIISMMQGVMLKGTGASIWGYDIGINDIAGKTGTTNNNSDLWFIGYTPQILAGAWVGCDDRSFVFSSEYWGQGAHGALPIWGYFFHDLFLKKPELKKNQFFVKPPNYFENATQFINPEPSITPEDSTSKTELED